MHNLSELLLDTALFFAACTAIFILGFIVDARAQAWKAVRSQAELKAASAAVQAPEVSHDGEGPGRSPA